MGTTMLSVDVVVEAGGEEGRGSVGAAAAVAERKLSGVLAEAPKSAATVVVVVEGAPKMAGGSSTPTRAKHATGSGFISTHSRPAAVRMWPLGAQAELEETAPAVVVMSGGQGSHEPSGFEDVGGGCKAEGSEGRGVVCRGMMTGCAVETGAMGVT